MMPAEQVSDMTASGEKIAPTFVVWCSKCEAPYEERKNLLNGKATWFPPCKHSVEWGRARAVNA